MNLLSAICRKARLAMMAKNLRKKGRSARNGNAPAPYTKYGKTPYRYSAEYYDWKRSIITNKPRSKEAWKTNDRNQVRENKMAAE